MLLACGASAQTRTVDILNADLVTVSSDSGGVVRRMTGNVRLRQDTTLLSSRTAVYDEARNLVTLTGNVRIVSGRSTITADEVVYRSDLRTAKARTNVRVVDGESVLRAPQATYDTRAEVSTFSGGGTITHEGAVITSPEGTYSSATRRARLGGPVTLVDSSGVLRARRGLYDARIQRADFGGDVHLRRPDSRLAADSLVYFRTTERARAYGRVALERIGESGGGRVTEAPADSSRRTFLFGETLLYDGRDGSASARGESRTGRPRRDPLLVTMQGRDDGGVDTTVVRAFALDAFRTVADDDTTQTLVANGTVRLADTRLSARADSSRLVRRAPRGGETLDRLRLFGATRPSTWADGAQLTGDTITVASRGGRADTLLVVGRAFSARIDSTVGRVQQLSGSRMQAFFDGDSLRRLAVWPGAEALTYRAEDGRLAGADRLASDSLSVTFGGGTVRDVRGYGGISGTAYGPRIVPQGVQLPGYTFEPDGAPTRDVILDLGGWEAAYLRDFGPAPEALRPPPDVRASALSEQQQGEAGEHEQQAGREQPETLSPP